MVNVLCATSCVVILASAVGSADASLFKCSGINYNIRAGPDWATADEKCKSFSQISTELATLKSVTDTIRLYSLTDCNQGTVVVPAAIEAGLRIELGIWVDALASSFEAEKEAFRTLLETGLVHSDNVVGIHVGSEAVYRGEITFEVAISNLKEIRTLCEANSGAANISLTIAEIGDTYMAYPSLIEAVDYVSANYFPFWESVDIDDAVDSFYERFSVLVENANTYNKKVIVGETGWASAGMNTDASLATATNAAKFFYDFYTLALKKNISYFYFAAFDEPWKLATLEANETVEAYFGLFTQKGQLKDTISATFNNTISSLNTVSTAAASQDHSHFFTYDSANGTNVLPSDNAISRATTSTTNMQSEKISDVVDSSSIKSTSANILDDGSISTPIAQTTLPHKNCAM